MKHIKNIIYIGLIYLLIGCSKKTYNFIGHWEQVEHMTSVTKTFDFKSDSTMYFSDFSNSKNIRFTFNYLIIKKNKDLYLLQMMSKKGIKIEAYLKIINKNKIEITPIIKEEGVTSTSQHLKRVVQ